MEVRSARWNGNVDTSAKRRLNIYTSASAATYAVNAQYAAYADQRGVFARRLQSNEDYKRLFRYDEGRPWFQPVLAFSSARLNLLGIATGVQILIFDVESKKVKHTLKGNGRIITSLAFSPSNAAQLATGGVDGSICVWSLKRPARPLYHLRAFHGACNHVAFHPTRPELLAGCHKDCLSIWAFPRTRPFLVTRSKDTDIKSLHWFYRDPPRVLAICATGAVSIYDIGSALKECERANVRRDFGDDEDTVFGKLEDIACVPSMDFDLGFQVSQALLIGRTGLIVLPQSGHVLFFITFSGEHETPTELWRLRLDDFIDCFSPRIRNGAVQVVACLGADTEAYEVPSAVLDGMGWDAESGARVLQPKSTIATALRGTDRAAPTMRPELSIYQRQVDSASRKRSRHVRFPVLALASSRKHEPVKPRKRKHGEHSVLPPSITSSLELPKPRGEDSDQDSPMPFLSPSIPARRDSDSVVSLDQNMQLPPRASFDSMASAAAHDSDSDDETFAENMQGSQSHLPGGVNVPLPRTCGAAFGPNGQLLTFLLARPRPISVMDDFAISDDFNHTRQDSEVTRLFPAFGNLELTPGSDAVTSDSESSASPPVARASHRPPLHTSSYEARQSWSAKISPVKQNAEAFSSYQKVNVSIREVEWLTQAQKSLAEKYRVFSEEDDEKIAEVCYQNASCAAAADLNDVADLWRLLALMLEQKEVGASVPAAADGMVPPSSSRPVMSRDNSARSSHGGRASKTVRKRLQWLQHPFGKTWAVAKVLEWAEGQADVQLLACISAILARVSEALDYKTPRRRANSAATDKSLPEGSIQDETSLPPGVPILRASADSIATSALEESPVKAPSPHNVSRDPSQPTTPYLDSSSSTPPFSFNPAARQNTVFSASDSASPDMHRNSFSAAAKYYAQSVSDKLASYGASPPLKRLGGSPNNELSSSLPTGAGSWSKSVSFASNIDHAYWSERSLSVAQEEEDRYDSDRTVDDTSLPHTPKPAPPGIIVREMNGFSFYDEPVTSLSTCLMPDHLLDKSQIWRDYYAEQLRSWNLLLEAAELNKVSISPAHSQAVTGDPSNGIYPTIPPGARGPACGICFCLLDAAEHLCPACFHATHPACLEELLHVVGDEDFTCPTGCGCDCLTVGLVQYELQEEHGSVEEVEGTTGRPPVRKNMSLTDPRYLRAKMQNDAK
jgi:hypothetical protein